MKIPIKCISCGEIVEVEATTEELLKRIGGAKAQDAFPNMSADHREMFISQTCGVCYDSLCPDDDDDDDEQDSHFIAVAKR